MGNLIGQTDLILAFGISAAIYSTIGGFRAAIWKDVLQSHALRRGCPSAALCGLNDLEGTFWVVTHCFRKLFNTYQLIFFSLDPTVRMTMVTAAMFLLCSICTLGSA